MQKCIIQLAMLLFLFGSIMAEDDFPIGVWIDPIGGAYFWEESPEIDTAEAIHNFAVMDTFGVDIVNTAAVPFMAHLCDTFGMKLIAANAGACEIGISDIYPYDLNEFAFNGIWWEWKRYMLLYRLYNQVLFL